jgi:effector-binding domain-containing protein
MKTMFIALFALTGLRTLPSWHSQTLVRISAAGRSSDTSRTPALTVADTTVGAMTLLAIRDTAATMSDMSQTIGRDYGELFAFVNQNQLRPGKIMAFYHSAQPPFILDAAVEIDKRPGQLTGRVKLKETRSGNAVVAHYQGPYDQIGIAYTAIFKRIKGQNKIPDGSPFEVYLNDPMSVKDPFDLRTDVYQLMK